MQSGIGLTVTASVEPEPLFVGRPHQTVSVVWKAVSLALKRFPNGSALPKRLLHSEVAFDRDWSAALEARNGCFENRNDCESGLSVHFRTDKPECCPPEFL